MSMEKGPSFGVSSEGNNEEIKREKPLGQPNAYMAPEMHEAVTQGEVVESKDFIEWGGKKLHIGDNAIVLRNNGTVEDDWTLKSFGQKFAVAEKVDVKNGEMSRKVVPIDEFGSWQTILEKDKEPNAGSVEGNKSGVDKGNRKARIWRQEDSKKFAEDIGIDTSKTDWMFELEKKIREITGA